VFGNDGTPGGVAFTDEQLAAVGFEHLSVDDVSIEGRSAMKNESGTLFIEDAALALNWLSSVRSLTSGAIR
jgi:hypothetical protein